MEKLNVMILSLKTGVKDPFNRLSRAALVQSFRSSGVLAAVFVASLTLAAQEIREAAAPLGGAAVMGRGDLAARTAPHRPR